MLEFLVLGVLMKEPASDGFRTEHLQVAVPIDLRDAAVVEDHGRMLHPFQGRHLLLDLLEDALHVL